MPAESHIKYFNKNCIAKVNGDFVGGRFSWTCSSCISLEEGSSKENSPDRYALLESIVVKNTKQHDSALSNLNETLIALNKKIEDLSFSALARNHKSAETSRQSIEPTSCSQSSASSAQNHDAELTASSSSWNKIVSGSKKSNRTPASNPESCISDVASSSLRHTHTRNFNFRVRVYTKDANKSILSVLKTLSNENKLECFENFQSRGKSTLDFLFATGDEAHAAYTKISRAFNSLDYADCFTPDLIKSQKAFLVGVSQSDDTASIRSKIHARYPELQLTSANKHNFKVLSPKQCKNEESGFRSTVFFSPGLYDYLSTNLNNRLRMGNYESWSIYPCKIGRCSKCQSLNHDTEDCKAKSPVCANCSGNHWTRKCNARESDICCINCKRSEVFNDNFMGHKASSSECPVYLNLTKNS